MWSSEDSAYRSYITAGRSFLFSWTSSVQKSSSSQKEAHLGVVGVPPQRHGILVCGSCQEVMRPAAICRFDRARHVRQRHSPVVERAVR